VLKDVQNTFRKEKLFILHPIQYKELYYRKDSIIMQHASRKFHFNILFVFKQEEPF